MISKTLKSKTIEQFLTTTLSVATILTFVGVTTGCSSKLSRFQTTKTREY